MRYQLKSFLLASVFAGSLVGFAAHAQEATPTEAAPTPLTAEQRIERLEQELETLKRQRDLDQELDAASAARTPAATLDKKALKFVSADGKYEFSLNAQVNVDAHTFRGDGGALRDEIVDRLIRPTFSGRAGNASFRFTPELGGSSSAAASIVDAYIEYKFVDALQLRAGKFKSPLGLERLQADADVIWTERGPSTNLVPNRDVGYQIFGALIPSVLEYQIGVFNGAADGVNLNNDLDNHKDVVYRIFANPFANTDIVLLQGFGIGYAGSTGKHIGTTANTQLSTYKTPGQQTFFSYASGTFSNGTEKRENPQAYFYYNNFGLLADYVRVTQDVKLGAAVKRLKNTALDVSGSWVLTGEPVGYKGGVKPAHDFDLKNGGWGALELTARYGYTDVDNAAFGTFASLTTSASKATSTGLGLAWYLSENLKLLADYDVTTFQKGAAAGKDRPDEKFVSGRVQFRY